MIGKLKSNLYLQLFVSFFRVGIFTIGGGYAMLPMLRKEVVEKHGWATDEEMLDYFAIGQSTPGIIAINTSTFIGFKKGGIIGGIFATLGMVTPSWIIIISIAKFFEAFSENEYVANAFTGIRVIVVVLIVNAVIKMGKKSIKNWIHILIFVVAYLLIVFSVIPTFLVVIISGIVGVIISTVKVGAKE